jgi:hypothetical protein
MSAESFSVDVNGRVYEIDPRHITFGERRRIRVELAKLEGESDGFDFTAGLIWTFVRRVEPDITLEQIMDSVTLGEAVESVIDDADPEG